MVFRTGVGFEISGRDLRVAVVRSSLGKLRLMQSFDIGGFVELTVQERETTFLNAARTHQLRPGSAFLTLPRDQGIVRQIEIPAEAREKLKQIVALQLETLCPWPEADIYWDFAADAAKKGARTITVTVVVIPRAVLDPWIEFFKSVNLPLSGASLSTVVCAHGVRNLWPDGGPTVILDCEQDYVEGSLLQGSRLTSVTQKDSEVAAAAAVVVQRLASSFRGSSPDTARVIAYGSSIESMDSLQRVSLPFENPKSQAGDRFAAVSAALVLLKRSAFGVNLVPFALRYRRNQMQLIPTYVLIACAFLLGVAMMLREPYNLMVYASRLDEQIKGIAPQVREVSSQENDLNQLSEKYRALAGHLQNGDRNLEALRELARVLPPAAWLSNYSYQDGNITVSGFAASASEVQRVLEDSSLFKEVQFGTSVTRDAEGRDRFTLRMAVEMPR